jgi:hypothetical protein
VELISFSGSWEGDDAQVGEKGGGEGSDEGCG